MFLSDVKTLSNPANLTGILFPSLDWNSAQTKLKRQCFDHDIQAFCIRIQARRLCANSLFLLLRVLCFCRKTEDIIWALKILGSWYILKWSESHSVVSNSLWPHGLYSPRNSPGQDTGVGSRSLLQVIFPTQGSNPGLPHCRWILYQLSHNGSPRILEWVAIPFSSGSSRPRNQIGISCIKGGFFNN